jgi:hypothetical protein
MTATLSTADLHQYTGDIIRYSHPLNPQVIYTPGVRHVAEQGGAYWLIDAMASYYGTDLMTAAINRDPRIASMHFWRLVVDGQAATLTAEADQGEEPFIRQDIEYTDFPLEKIEVWAGFDGAHWTLYLPSEH